MSVVFSYARNDPKTLADLADLCIQRANAARWHENVAHILALEYFMGACVGAATAGNQQLANEIANAALVVAKRGMTYVRVLAMQKKLAVAYDAGIIKKEMTS
jgi:hypothetical protein